MECNIAIITACIPTLRPMFKETFGGNSSGRSNKSAAIFSGPQRSRPDGIMELNAYGGHSSQLRNSIRAGGDNESEEHILSTEMTGIRKTLDVEMVSQPLD